MPRTRIDYDPILLHPPDSAPDQLPSGQSVQFQIFRDGKAERELVRCDLCGGYYQISGQRNVFGLARHRNSEECHRLLRKQNKSTSDEVVFSRLFAVTRVEADATFQRVFVASASESRYGNTLSIFT